MTGENSVFRIGDEIGNRFQVREFLGHGGFGDVYRVFDKNLQIEIALKTLRSSENRLHGAGANFLSEARKQAQLRNNPHVVTIYDHGELEHEGETFPFISMELLTTDLKKRMNGQRLPISVSCQIAFEIAEALVAAQQQNMVHRDIKPQNIMLDVNGRAMLSDFGLAKIISDAADGNSTLFGTPGYTAPEQLLLNTNISKADIYSLGCTLVTMLTGGPPLNRRMFSLRAYLPEAPYALEKLISQMLQDSPDSRPSAAQVSQKLTQIIVAQKATKTRYSPNLKSVGLSIGVAFSLMAGGFVYLQNSHPSWQTSASQHLRSDAKAMRQNMRTYARNSSSGQLARSTYHAGINAMKRLKNSQTN
ncbi:serine/threonine protein kinase [bacterium]|nr:MAG: serine/threonine protein kinase [bacterium]